MIHSLHCVNQLRKAVYAHYYFPGKPTDFFFIHMSGFPLLTPAVPLWHELTKGLRKKIIALSTFDSLLNATRI